MVIHTGSRNLGKQVAEIYQNKAIQYHENKLFNKKEAISKVITEYKQEGRQKEEVNYCLKVFIELRFNFKIKSNVLLMVKNKYY